MGKVKILLSYGSSVNRYIEAIESLGAEAVAEYLPPVDTSYDGLLLCGGNDIDPKRYGEEINGAVNIDYERDEAEFALLKAYVEAGKPVFGICRGYQLMNAFFGGTLYQHLPETDKHRSADSKYDLAHEVKAIPGSVLANLYGESFTVNTSHHQAVKVLGDGLRATAFWNDRYIEAFEHSSLPILGVQWHPERMCFACEREDTVSGADILKYFVDLCKKHS